jgi:glutamyl/glutaminyl-tRNA synthetase
MEAFIFPPSPEEVEPADKTWLDELGRELVSVAPEGWCSRNLKNILKDFQKKHELKGKTVYHALRIKLTGAGHGVPIALFMGCLGKEKALERFDTADALSEFEKGGF